MIKVYVTQEDIDENENPLQAAISRAVGEDCIVDKAFVQFIGDGREALPKRLPLSAEKFAKQHYKGEAVQPFEFEL